MDSKLGTKSKKKILQSGWLVMLGLSSLYDSFIVYINPFPRENEKKKDLITSKQLCNYY